MVEVRPTGTVKIIGPDSARISPTRPAKSYDMHGPLTQLASYFTFYYFITIYYVQIKLFSKLNSLFPQIIARLDSMSMTGPRLVFIQEWIVM